MYSFGIAELRDAEATLRNFTERHYAGIIIYRQHKISYLHNSHLCFLPHNLHHHYPIWRVLQPMKHYTTVLCHILEVFKQRMRVLTLSKCRVFIWGHACVLVRFTLVYIHCLRSAWVWTVYFSDEHTCVYRQATKNIMFMLCIWFKVHCILMPWPADEHVHLIIYTFQLKKRK